MKRRVLNYLHYKGSNIALRALYDASTCPVSWHEFLYRLRAGARVRDALTMPKQSGTLPDAIAAYLARAEGRPC